MTQEQILEGNKLIAEFMGLEYETNPFNFEMSRCIKNGYIEKPFITHLKYNNSWDWLMPVVLKIIDLKDTYGQERYKVHMSINPKIDITYKAVVEFIKWYNQNKS